MNRKPALLVHALLVAALFLGGCGAKDADRPWVIIVSGEPGSADPAENQTLGGLAYLPHVYETLYTFYGDESPALSPNLANGYPEVTPDGLTYKIYIKREATFHDGTAVTADAVVYSYERMLALDTGPASVTAGYIESIRALNPYAVEIVLKEPYTDFLASVGGLWGNYIINPAVCQEHEVNGDWCSAWLQSNDAGSGPYTLAGVDPAGQTVSLSRYQDWWQTWSNNKKAPDHVLIRWLDDPGQARLLLEQDEADILINPPAADFAALRAAGYSTSRNTAMTQYYLAFNSSAAPLDDPLVRQALQYSFPAERVIDEIFDGNLLAMDNPIGPGYTTLYQGASQYPYDLEQAGALLAEAGYPDGFELTANAMGFWPNDEAVLEMWQADLAQIGVTLTIQPLEPASWSEAWLNCQASGTPGIGQVSALAVSPDYPSLYLLLAEVYSTPRLDGGACSMVYLDNEGVNENLASLGNVSNSAERKAIFDSTLAAIADDAGAIWVGQAMELVVLRNMVRGYSYSFSLGSNYVPLHKMFMDE